MNISTSYSGLTVVYTLASTTLGPQKKCHGTNLPWEFDQTLSPLLFESATRDYPIIASEMYSESFMEHMMLYRVLQVGCQLQNENAELSGQL